MGDEEVKEYVKLIADALKREDEHIYEMLKEMKVGQERLEKKMDQFTCSCDEKRGGMWSEINESKRDIAGLKQDRKYTAVALITALTAAASAFGSKLWPW